MTAVAAIRLGLLALREQALGDTADIEDQAAVLQALHDDRHREDSVLGMVWDLLADLGAAIGDQGAEEAAEAIDEAAGYVQDTGPRLERARAALTEETGR